jgi:5'-3' exonuclease
VRGERIVQVDRRANAIRDTNEIFKKFGVIPFLIPDFLALVGDSADGYPGIPGIGKAGAARLLNQYGPIENFPETLLKEQRERALLFKRLATLRTDAKLFTNVEQLKWRGPSPAFAGFLEKIGEPSLLDKANVLAAKIAEEGKSAYSPA